MPCFEFVDEQTQRLEGQSAAQGQGLEWGSPGWRRMTWQKVFLVDKVVDW